MTAIVEALGPGLARKTVALVGNARSLGDSACGQAIDACDIVVRLNAAPHCAAISHGVRTSWLASSLMLPAARLKALQPQRLLWMSPKRRILAAAVFGWRLPMTYYPAVWWRDLSAALGGARPSTGMMTIDLIHRIGGYAELRLFGFDFFQSGSLSTRGLAAPPPHDFAREQALVMGLLGTDRRIRLMGAAPATGEAAQWR